jgi:hypothetical protein
MTLSLALNHFPQLHLGECQAIGLRMWSKYRCHPRYSDRPFDC